MIWPLLCSTFNTISATPWSTTPRAGASSYQPDLCSSSHPTVTIVRSCLVLFLWTCNIKCQTSMFLRLIHSNSNVFHSGYISINNSYIPKQPRICNISHVISNNYKFGNWPFIAGDSVVQITVITLFVGIFRGSRTRKSTKGGGF